MAVTNVNANNMATINAASTQNGTVHVYFNPAGITGTITYTLGTGVGVNAPVPIPIPITNGGPHTIMLGGQQFNILNFSNKTVQLMY